MGWGEELLICAGPHARILDPAEQNPLLTCVPWGIGGSGVIHPTIPVHLSLHDLNLSVLRTDGDSWMIHGDGGK